jgi:hypothetical protein
VIGFNANSDMPASRVERRVMGPSHVRAVKGGGGVSGVRDSVGSVGCRGLGA